MIHVAQQTEGEDDGAGHDGELAVAPVGRGDGAVPGQPAAQAGGVAELEAEGGQEDDGVDGRHGIVEDERREKGSIEIVDCLEMFEVVVASFCKKPKNIFPPPGVPPQKKNQKTKKENLQTTPPCPNSPTATLLPLLPL